MDEPLKSLDDIARERARLGLRTTHGNHPLTFCETMETSDGLKLLATWSPDGVDAHFLPVEISRPDSSVVDVFVDARDADERSRKRTRRAAKRGTVLSPAKGPSESQDEPEPRFKVGQPFTFVATAGCRRYPPWVWPAALAKVTLACLSHGVALGLWNADTIDEITVYALRMLAFDHLYSPDVWSSKQICSAPMRPVATHELVGNLARGEHLFALHAPEYRAQPPLAQLVLFGRMLVELPLPGVSVSRSYAWIFFARSRRVAHGTVAHMAEMLRRERRLTAQLSLL